MLTTCPTYLHSPALSFPVLSCHVLPLPGLFFPSMPSPVIAYPFPL